MSVPDLKFISGTLENSCIHSMIDLCKTSTMKFNEKMVLAFDFANSQELHLVDFIERYFKHEFACSIFIKISPANIMMIRRPDVAEDLRMVFHSKLAGIILHKNARSSSSDEISANLYGFDVATNLNSIKFDGVTPDRHNSLQFLYGRKMKYFGLHNLVSKSSDTEALKAVLNNRHRPLMVDNLEFINVEFVDEMLNYLPEKVMTLVIKKESTNFEPPLKLYRDDVFEDEERDKKRVHLYRMNEKDFRNKEENFPDILDPKEVYERRGGVFWPFSFIPFMPFSRVKKEIFPETELPHWVDAKKLDFKILNPRNPNRLHVVINCPDKTYTISQNAPILRELILDFRSRDKSHDKCDIDVKNLPRDLVSLKLAGFSLGDAKINFKLQRFYCIACTIPLNKLNLALNNAGALRYVIFDESIFSDIDDIDKEDGGVKTVFRLSLSNTKKTAHANFNTIKKVLGRFHNLHYIDFIGIENGFDITDVYGLLKEFSKNKPENFYPILNMQQSAFEKLRPSQAEELQRRYRVRTDDPNGFEKAILLSAPGRDSSTSSVSASSSHDNLHGMQRERREFEPNLSSSGVQEHIEEQERRDLRD
ncbi:hypothetical protein MP638_000593 [Amoeboaphelidium occidentale]|nr:hypothetical protein MP638_000593 [Amoeboaphelidium occidentale]